MDLTLLEVDDLIQTKKGLFLVKSIRRNTVIGTLRINLNNKYTLTFTNAGMCTDRTKKDFDITSIQKSNKFWHAKNERPVIDDCEIFCEMNDGTHQIAWWQDSRFHDMNDDIISTDEELFRWAYVKDIKGAC